jgi:hypothetical protein
MRKKFPCYELHIDELNEAIVQAIALVESPAIESHFLAFSTEQKNLTFSLDEERRELIGAAMIPDQKIYRIDEEGYEYEVFFSKETIRKISQIFFKKGFQSNLNIEHKDLPADSFIFQSYIVDEGKGMLSPKGLNLPDGSWVVGVKVNNNDIWKDIKSGKRKGFSVEGVFGFIKHDFKVAKSDEDEVLEMIQQLKQLIQNTHI